MATEETRKRPPAKKSTARKSTTKATQKRPPHSESDGRSRSMPSKAPKASEIANSAVQQLVELTGRTPEGVTGLERTEDGWTVSVDVLDLHRVPETTDVLACYEVEVDEQGDLTGYRRVHRYVRGSPGEERG
ncbi:MAG: gas vesicle protein [Actinomycetes bacterium]